VTPTDAELGAAWRDEMASKEAELAERKRDLVAARASLYDGERDERVANLESRISVVQSDIIALGLVLERARKVAI
jgi:hypothetical protein